MKKIKGISRGLPWLMAVGLSGLVAACGGGDQSPILGVGSLAPVASVVPVVPPAVALSVTAVTPLPNATGLALNTKTTTATFNKPMDTATINANSFTLACPAATPISGGIVTYVVASQIATFTLPASTLLPANTQCKATVTTTAKDSTGIALAANYVWVFNTGATTDTTAPTVSDTVNANGASNVAINTKVGATFSEALNPLSVTNANVTLKQTVSGAAVTGTTRYSGVDAVFIPSVNLQANTQYTATIKGGITGVEDLANNAMAADYSWSWTTAAVADTTPPLVTLVNPAESALNVPVSSAVNATFNEAMDPLTINTANFKVAGVTGVVSFNALTKVATFTPNTALTAGTTYTATVTRGVSDLAGNTLASDKVWTFSTAALPVVVVAIPLNTVAPFGTFGGTAGMTNMGTLTLVNGDIGTTGTEATMVTGFHDTSGDIYTETGSNKGAVNGKIYSCTHSTTGPTSAGVNAPACAAATQARLDAQTAYLALVAKPVGGASPAPGANLAGITLLPGTYVAPGGSFLIEGGNLTLDAQGDANATWVFQMATTLTVGGPGAAFPQSIILAGGALAKNVFWQVGSFATINAAGGGTMVGTIISQEGASFSTAGNVNIVTLNGRALSLGASVTLVNTVINVPTQ
jgi:hypothetical protein